MSVESIEHTIEQYILTKNWNCYNGMPMSEHDFDGSPTYEYILCLLYLYTIHLVRFMVKSQGSIYFNSIATRSCTDGGLINDQHIFRGTSRKQPRVELWPDGAIINRKRLLQYNLSTFFGLIKKKWFLNDVSSGPLVKCVRHINKFIVDCCENLDRTWVYST